MKRNYIKNFFGHLYTITHHRHLVIRHAFRCGIGFQALGHDLSKYGPTEFFPGVKYYTGSKSPTLYERIEEGMSKAWMHHKGRNKHHYEYWTDYDLTDEAYKPVLMPMKYLKEMFCDRVAASKTYMKKEYTDAHPYNYFVSKRTVERMNEETAKVLESWLLMLKEKGEKETFKYIKKMKKD